MPKHRKRDQWKVVLAEDTDENALLIQVALERASSIPVRVHRARNGDTALLMIEDLVPDLVLLDLQMPGKSGHEVLEAIKKNHELRRIPVAVLTASKLDEDISLSYGLGGNHFITKPDDPYKLVEQLRVLLEYADNLSGRSGSGNLEATAVSAVNPSSFVIQNFLLRVALAIVIVGLLVLPTSGAFRAFRA